MTAVMAAKNSEFQSTSKPSTKGSVLILTGLLLGIGCGIFFGDVCQPLEIVGDVFVGLLQMTIMPYIVVSLVANLGRLTTRQGRQLAATGGVVIAILWGITLFTIFCLSQTFPKWRSGSFFSSSLVQGPKEFDFVSVFIPSNIFASLAEYHVPAVILMCIFVGVSVAKLESRAPLISLLDDLATVLIGISRNVIRFAPIGVFAMAASTAGTMSWAELGRLQAYLVTYTAGALFLGFFVLPYLITVCTPFRYREVMSVSRDAMITAFATGKLIIVIPIIIERTEQLFAESQQITRDDAVPAVDVLYPVAYPFPHTGKLLSMLFIPFTAWFLGNAISVFEYPKLFGTGIFSYFGGPLLALPHLLDVMQLPHDMFQLFLLSGVLGERLGDAVGVMHLVAFTLITTSRFAGILKIHFLQLVRFVSICTIAGFLMVIVLRLGLSNTLKYVESRSEVLENMQLLKRPVPHEVHPESAPNPDPLKQGETLLQRIKRRGTIRIGYNEDKLPFAFFNINGKLVGFDVEMAHALAWDLGVDIEFVKFNRGLLNVQLANDNFDIVMSGLVGTLERAQTMQHTSPYMDVTLGLVVPDFQVRGFRNIESLRSRIDLRIGFVDLSRGFVDRFQEALPQAKLIELPSNKDYFYGDWKALDALLISAESGSAYTLLHPEFEVVVPDGLNVSFPLFYAIGSRDTEMRDLLEHWINLRKRDGTTQEFYDHWILGKTKGNDKPRWCVIRDVLHWID